MKMIIERGATVVLPKSSVNRVAVFAFYDKDGMVDDYICVLLQEMKVHCRKLLFVVNGELSSEGRVKIEQLGAEILMRENAGLDISGYKAGILYLEETLSTYDELVMLNQTIYGPIYPFAEMFDEMNARDVDFWGMTKHPGIDEDPWGTAGGERVPAHLQSYFVVVRKPMLTSEDFLTYWKELPTIETYYDAVGGHEAWFTERFEQKGYKSDVYINAEDLNAFYDYPLITNAYTMAVDYKCPVMKRKAFFISSEALALNTIDNGAQKLFDWLGNEHKYDPQLILDNLIRLEPYGNILARLSTMHFLRQKEEKPKPYYCTVYDNELAAIFGKLLKGQKNITAIFENENAKNNFLHSGMNVEEVKPFRFKALLQVAAESGEPVCMLTNADMNSTVSELDYELMKSNIEELLVTDAIKMAPEHVGAVIPYPSVHGVGVVDSLVYEMVFDKSENTYPPACNSRCFMVTPAVATEMLQLITDDFCINDALGAYLPVTACCNLTQLVDTVLTEERSSRQLAMDRYMIDEVSKIWATPYKRNIILLLFRMQAVLDFFNERRYKMTVEQAITGNLSFKEKMWIALQLFLKPTTFEKVRKFFSGGKPPAQEVHERDNID